MLWIRRHTLAAGCLALLLVLATAAALRFRAAASPVSPLLYGTNLGLFNAQDQFLTSAQTRADFQQIHVGLVRIPIRTFGGIGPDEVAALQDVHALGLVPLVILKYSQTNALAADQIVLQSAVQLFGTAPVYAEFGNERDLAGVDQSSYTSTWNSIVPTLASQFPTVRFGGPVNFQYNPPYVASFVHNATPKPAFISWHEYTCGNSDSAQYCLDHIANWATHISQTRAAITANGDTVPPIFITEWNYDPSPPSPDPRDTPAFQSQFVQTALAQLAADGVSGAAQYVATGNSAYNLINPDGTLSAAGVAFGQAAAQAAGGSTAAPPASATATTAPAASVTPPPSATPTASPAATLVPPSTTASTTPSARVSPTTPPPTATPVLPSATATPVPPMSTEGTGSSGIPPVPTSGSVVVQDSFSRPDQTGWGTAGSGQPWTSDATGAPFAISADAGQVGSAGTPVQGIIGPTLTDSQVLVSGTAGSFVDSNFGPVLRWQDPNDWYKVYLDGFSLVVQKAVQGAHTILAQVPFAAQPHTAYTIRAQVVGTTLAASAWPTGGVAPSGWMVQASDSSLSQGQDGVRLQVFNSQMTLQAFVIQQLGSGTGQGSPASTSGSPLPTRTPTHTIPTETATPEPPTLTPVPPTATTVPASATPDPTADATATLSPWVAGAAPLLRRGPTTGSVVVDDSFSRPDQTGWGTAGSGQPWSADATSAPFAIAADQGQVRDTSGPVQGIIGPSLADSEVLLTGKLSSFSNNNFGAVLRWQDPNNWYQVYLEDSALVIQKSVQGGLTTLTEVPFAASPNTAYTLRAQVVGTSIAASVWPAGSAAPSGWMAQVTDSSLSQGQDGVRLQALSATADVSAFILQELP